MKSINKMFSKGGLLISTYLNGGDRVERAVDSVFQQLVLRDAMQLIHILLFANLPPSPPPLSLRLVLLSGVALVVDEEGVHIRPQSNELGDRLAVPLIHEIPNRFPVGRNEKWAGLFQIGEADVLTLAEVLRVDVGRLNPGHERLGVREEHLSRRVLLL